MYVCMYVCVYVGLVISFYVALNNTQQLFDWFRLEPRRRDYCNAKHISVLALGVCMYVCMYVYMHVCCRCQNWYRNDFQRPVHVVVFHTLVYILAIITNRILFDEETCLVWWVSECMYVYVYACVCILVYVCWVCMYMCVCVYVWVFLLLNND